MCVRHRVDCADMKYGVWERWLIHRDVRRNAEQNSNNAACGAGGQNKSFSHSALKELNAEAVTPASLEEEHSRLFLQQVAVGGCRIQKSNGDWLSVHAVVFSLVCVRVYVCVWGGSHADTSWVCCTMSVGWDDVVSRFISRSLVAVCWRPS